jgi:hypothetical protein
MEPWQPTLSKGSHSLLRRHRRLAVVGVAALILALPVAVSASHQFSDVPTSNTYHTSISRLVGAGLTGGCGGGKYCPNDPVTRGQMAAFLNRGLGRAGQASGETDGDLWTTVEPGALGAPAVVFLTTGGAAGGTAYVQAQGNFAAWTNEAGVCPCEIVIALLSETGELSTISLQIIDTEASPAQGYFEGSASISHLFPVPSGTEVGFALIAQITPTNAPTAGSGHIAEYFFSLQATYVPFAEDGGNAPAPVVTAGRPKLPFGKWPFGDHKLT